MRRRLEKRLDAYRDGAYRDGGPDERLREALGALIERDPEAGRRVRRTDALGRAVRSAWTEGPAAPTPERFVSAIRPELARIDAELDSERAGSRGLSFEPLRALLRPVPLGTLAAAACAVVLVLVLPGTPGSGPGSVPGGSTVVGEVVDPTLVARADPAQSDASFAGSQLDASLELEGSPSAIYDLAQGDTPLMVFESPDGSTVIWMLDPEDQLTGRAAGRERLA